MADTSQQSYLSIGEVLGLLLEEFPDVTISKIRFLESQGLISPERTSSGYRKFYEDDVELLRVILTEQRQNFLPLRVIKDRLETGEIDPTGEHLKPRTDDDTPAGSHADDGDDDPEEPADVPSSSVAAHPASNGRAGTPRNVTANGVSSDGASAGAEPVDETPDESETETAEPAGADGAQLLPGVVLDRAELCAMVGMTESELDQLENFGVVTPAEHGTGLPLYDTSAVEIAKPACAFLRLGVDARHLRNFRTAAEREASLYEQLVAPRFRQRNPEAQAEALSQLRELDVLGGKLRAALMRRGLGHHFR